MMLWGVRHDPRTTAPAALIAQLEADLDAAARAIRREGGIQAFLESL